MIVSSLFEFPPGSIFYTIENNSVIKIILYRNRSIETAQFIDMTHNEERDPKLLLLSRTEIFLHKRDASLCIIQNLEKEIDQIKKDAENQNA